MLELTVTGMTCEHCVRAVSQAVKSVPGAHDVSVDLGSGRVTVRGTPDAAAVAAAIHEEGYEVAGITAPA